ncbi:MAG: tetratricopeptide repeat protein [Spirochaetes bacterium]|nr:tetratricopeptide repeat protein [Spirochaetota bacterium]
MNAVQLFLLCSILLLQQNQPVNKEAILETILSETKPAKTIPMQFNATANDESQQKGGSTPDEVLLKQGVELYNAELYERSLQLLERLQKDYPQSPFKDQASLWKAKIFMQQQKYTNAMNELLTINDQSGQYPAALFMSGRVNQAMGKPFDAIEQYTKVSSLYPDQDFSDDALILSAQLYISQKKGNAALQALIRVIKQYPDRETVDDAYYWLGRILATDPNLKDIELARKVYTIFLKRAEDPAYIAFYSSPLKERVADEIKRIDAIYFPEQ